MTSDRIGAIGSQDDKLARVKKFLKNPIGRQGGNDCASFVAFDFSKTGNVPGYSNVSIHTQTSYS